MSGIIFFGTLCFMAWVFAVLAGRSERDRTWPCYQCGEPIWVRGDSFVHVSDGLAWRPYPPTEIPPGGPITVMPHRALPKAG